MRPPNRALKAVATFVVLSSPCFVGAGEDLPRPLVVENPQVIMNRIDQLDDFGDRSRHRADAYGYVHIEQIEKYLNDLYNDQKQTVQMPMLRGRVVIVNRGGLYATSSEAGNIYLGVGWAMVIDREVEWAALIAHEFSHILLGHHALGSEGKKAAAATDLSGVLSAFVKPGSHNKAKVDAFNANLKSFGEYSDKNLHPSMSRGTEIAADALAVRILAAGGYSFVDGLFSAINRVEANEAQNQEMRAHPKVEVAKQVARNNTKKTTWKDFMREMKETSRKGLAEGLRGDGKSHPDTEARLKALAEFIELNFSNYAPTNVRGERWTEIKTLPDVQSRLRSYAFARELLDALLARNYSGLDQRIQGIPALENNVDDGMFSLLLGIYHSKKGNGSTAAAHFVNAAINDQGNWVALEAYYSGYRSGNLTREQMAGFYFRQFDRFGRPDQMLPRVIRVLREGGYEPKAAQLQKECEQKFPNEKPICAGVNWVGF